MKAYPAYKDSGVEWIGEIPEHWDCSKLKWQIKINSGENLKSEEVTAESDYPVYGGNGITGYSTKYNYLGSTLIIGRVGAHCGSIHLASDKKWVTDNALVVSTSLDHRFMYYLLEAMNLNRLANKNAQPLITGSMVKDQFAPLPNDIEQRTIARFLTHKTHQVDTAIARLERLIDLLQEERAAVINEAVTRGLRGEAARQAGLDPDPPMKDSGVEWIGEVPKHWEVVKLKYVTPNVTVGIVITPSKHYVSGGVPCLRSFNIKEMKITNKDLAFISEESNEALKKSKIFEGDIVSVRTGKAGTTAVVPKEFDNCNCVDLIIIRKDEAFNSHFLGFLLNSDFSKRQFGTGSTGAIQQHFNIETASNMLIMLPPIEEQNRIVEFLFEKLGLIDEDIETINKEIVLLREYRQSLISEAVTGKIDVREYPIP